jgi:hypothetical protein
VRPIRTAVVAASTALLALLAGCGTENSNAGSGGSQQPASNGVENKPVNEILSSAKAALSKASSVHIKGSAKEDGDTFEIDMSVRGTDGGTGSITVEGKKVELIRSGKAVYMKGDDDFWTTFANAEAAKLLSGKWLKGTTEDPKLKDLASFTDLSTLAAQFLKPGGTLTKDQKKTVNGTAAIGLKDASKDGGILYVATTGEPYPLQLVPTEAGQEGQVDFLDYGKPVDLKEPPAAETIDVKKLGNG